MSAIVNKIWDWSLSTVKGGSSIGNIQVVVWDSTSTTAIQNTTTDDDGLLNSTIKQTEYSIDNTDDITTTTFTPHILGVYKYGLIPKDLQIAFTSRRNDTFYMEDNNNITESDVTVVDDYTGIDIDHANEKITITENHTMEELYDYSQYDITQHPQKSFPAGVLKTNNGADFLLYYDLVIDGATLDGSGKYIDMHTKELTLQNDGSTNVKIQDKNGVLVSFGFTGLKANSEVRIYDASDMSEITGVENVEDSYNYNYNYTEDKDVIIVIYAVGYDPIRLSLTLSSADNSIPIQQQKDRWYKND